MSKQLRLLEKQCEEINKTLEERGVETRARVNDRMMRIDYYMPRDWTTPSGTIATGEPAEEIPDLANDTTLD